MNIIDPMSHNTRVEYAKRGKLIELLKITPMSKWNEPNDQGYTFLSYTFYSRDENNEDNIDALILLGSSCLFDFKSFPPGTTCSPFWYCIRNCNVKYAMVLCVMGYTYCHENPIGYITLEKQRFLVANGWRIANRNYNKSLVIFQEGVINCRDAIVTLLGLKKRRHPRRILPKLDRFLVQQELAIAIWATRSDENEKWQNK